MPPVLIAILGFLLVEALVTVPFVLVYRRISRV